MLELELNAQRYQAIFENLAREDGLLDEDGNISQAPHCDALVLHAPGICKSCDKYPDRQNARIARRVAFTGEEHHPTKSLCPSEYFRSAEVVHKWKGNRPVAELDEDVVVVEAIDIDDNVENKIDFSQIVSHLGSVTASLRGLMSPEKFVLHGNSAAESNLSSAEALLEILRSDFCPPIFFEPSATESVIVALAPDVHDIATSVEVKDGRVVVRIRPKMVKGD